MREPARLQRSKSEDDAGPGLHSGRRADQGEVGAVGAQRSLAFVGVDGEVVARSPEDSEPVGEAGTEEHARLGEVRRLPERGGSEDRVVEQVDVENESTRKRETHAKAD